MRTGFELSKAFIRMLSGSEALLSISVPAFFVFSINVSTHQQARNHACDSTFTLLLLIARKSLLSL